MAEAEGTDSTMQEKLAKSMVGLSLVRSFGTHYTAARLATNAVVLAAGYAVGEFNGLLVAAGVEVLNQGVRSLSSSSATMKAQEDFIDRHWTTLSKIPAVQWNLSRALGHLDLERTAAQPIALSKSLWRDFKLTAYETGVRQASVGPIYSLGKWAWQRLKRQALTP